MASLIGCNTAKGDNSTLLEALLDATAREVALTGIIAVRIGKGIRILPSLEHYNVAQLWL